MRKHRATIQLIYNSQEVLLDKIPDYEGLYIAPHGNLVFESKSSIDETTIKDILKSFMPIDDVVIYEGSQLLMKTVLVTSYIIFISQPLLTKHTLSSEPVDFLPDGHKVYPKTKIISNRHCLLVDTDKGKYYKDVEKIFIIYDFRRNKNE